MDERARGLKIGLGGLDSDGPWMRDAVLGSNSTVKLDSPEHAYHLIGFHECDLC